MLINNLDLILEILFTFTLFGLLAFVIYKLIKQYVLPSLYSEIEKIKKHDRELKEKSNLLVASKNRIQGQIKQQSDDFFLLEKKTKQWHQSIVDENKEIEEQDKSLLKKILEKRKKQDENLSLFKMQQIVIPESIKLACEKINSLYGGGKSLGLLKELVVTIEPGRK